MISLDHVSKIFRTYRKPSDWLREKIVRRPLHQIRRAVDDISFTVADGEVFGIIGRNGAGKSTLLKLIMGVLLPDTGAIQCDGRVTGLLELGTGFNPLFSGYDNITFNATLLGLTADEIAARRDAIIAFSELQPVIHNPLRTYSSGMTMRLAFSIAVHAEPACMVVDEALSVGDVRFQQKCMRRLKEFKAGGGSILFVSHDLSAIKLLCDRALVLDEGKAMLIGTPDEAAQGYYRILARMEGEENARPGGRFGDGTLSTEKQGYGTGEVEIIDVKLVGDVSGGAVVTAGEAARLILTVKAHAAVQEVTAGFHIDDRFGQTVFGTNSFLMGTTLDFAAGEVRDLVFTMPIDIYPGHYSVGASLHRGDTHLTDCFHWCDGIARFEVAGFGGPVFAGVARLRPVFSHHARAELGLD